MRRRVCALLTITLAVWGLLVLGALAERDAVTISQTPSEDKSPAWDTYGAWSEPELVSIPEPDVNARSPTLALGDGRAHLVWEQNGELRHAIRYADGWHLDDRLRIAGDSPAIALAVADPASEIAPSLDGVDSWRLHLVYAQASPFDAQFHIYHCTLDPDGWDMPRKVSDLGGHSGNPDIAVLADSGDVHVVWTSKRDGRDQIYHARSLDFGQSWHIVQPVSEAYGGAPSLCLDSHGRVWVAWQSTPVGEGYSDIWVTHWDGTTGSWSAPERVSGALEGDTRAPKLACGANGAAHLVWEQETPDGRLVVRHAYRSLDEQNAAWVLSPEPPGDGAPATAPNLALAPRGGAGVAWDAGGILRFSMFNGNIWSPSEMITATDGARHIVIAVDEQGGVRVAWSARQPSGEWVITSSWRSPKPALIPIEPPPTQEPSPTQTPNAIATVPLPTATATVRWGARWFMPLLMQNRTESITLTSTPKRVSAILNHSGPDLSPSTLSPSPTPTSLWAWEDAQFVGQASGTINDLAVLRTNAGGIHIVWSESFNGYSVLYHVHRAPMDAAWPVAHVLFVGEEPTLALGPDDNIHLVYSNTHDVFHMRWVDGTWRPPSNVSLSSGTSTQPAVTVRSDGTPVVVWSDTTGGDSRIHYGWLNDKVWNTFYVPSSTGGTAPDVCVGKNDRVWVGWQMPGNSGTSYEVYALHGSGENWTPVAANISENGLADSLGPQLTGISDRGAFIVWEEDADGSAEIHYADNLEVIDYWSEPVNISETGGFSRQPAIASSPSGAMAVAWQEHNGGGSSEAHIMIRWRRVPESSWSPAESMVEGDVRRVRLTLDDDGGVHAIWIENGTQIRYRSGSYLTPTPNMLSLPLIQRP
jgi:hypothetical protein